jgi:hypothetical protein
MCVQGGVRQLEADRGCFEGPTHLERGGFTVSDHRRLIAVVLVAACAGDKSAGTKPVSIQQPAPVAAARATGASGLLEPWTGGRARCGRVRSVQRDRSQLRQDVAARLRDHVLSVGNSVDPFDGYRAFRTRDATVDALMRARGFAVGPRLTH